MGIIFIDFSVNIDSKSRNPDSFYSISLKEQYENIKSRMPQNVEIIGELASFIEICFPTGLQKKYIITTPNFERKKRQTRYNTFLNNVAIKPELTAQMKRYLPVKTNVILFGDIQETDYQKKFIVTGIELIDSAIAGKTDIVVKDSYCVHSFQTNDANGKRQNQWTMPNAAYNETIFTPNFIAELIEKSFPLSKKNLMQFFEFHKKWEEFINFRLNYLREQSNRYFKIDSVSLLEGYSINKNAYFQNETTYEQFLLVDHNEFRKGEQILLNFDAPGAEPFNLIEVNIDFNKKEFDEGKVENNRGRKVNPLETQLKSLTRENLALSKVEPTPKTYERVLRNAHILGDRYKMISVNIEPDVTKIIEKYQDILSKEQASIELKYKRNIKDKLLENKNQKTKDLEQEKTRIINDYESDFYDGLDEAVELNADDEIKRALNKQIKLKEAEINKKLKGEKKKDKKLLASLNDELSTFINSIDIRALYIEKHEKAKDKLIRQITKTHEIALKEFLRAKEQELTIFYNREKEQELIKNVVANEALKKEDINQKILNETIKRFSIYFKVEQDNVSKKMNKDIKANEFIIYNNRAEKAKLDRQKQSLDNFYKGNVKNPYLATYLFGPDELVNKEAVSDFSNWNWHLEYLNDKQKEAVFKAVNSNGIFLLQGPPGTGKTQVIAEIVSQFVQRGKKVVIASETHKAIDNVFERLPYLADIRPLRLLPDRTTKETEYKPENLVDNFYGNIAKKMKKTIRDYERFNLYQQNFSDELLNLKMLNDKILREKEGSLQIQNKINELSTQNEYIKENISINKEKINNYLAKIDVLRRTYRRLENSQLNESDDIEVIILRNYLTEALEYIKEDAALNRDDIIITVRELLNLNSEIIMDELKRISVQESAFMREQRESEIRRSLKELQDDFGDWKEGTEKARKVLQGELKKILSGDVEKADFSNIRILKIMKEIDTHNHHYISEQLLTHKEKLVEIRNKYFIVINEEIAKLEIEKNRLDGELAANENKRADITNAINELYQDSNYQSIIDDESRLRINIAKFIEDFNVSIKYNTYSEAIAEIEKAYDDLEKNFVKKEEQNKQIIPVFTKISKYLENDDVILADRKKYTKTLFDKVNVFGITTTSRDKFTQSAISDLEQYNLNAIDLKEQGIDVVIIDEVSKSNFLDLLTPILLGKTVILVGDHRQLPPMYDLRNLRAEDYENISDEILTKEKNDEYTKLFETSFFKTLFEKIPSDYKVMLDKQYRSHEHIMEVYNCFYNHDLKIGTDGQNAEKQHHLSIVSNNRQIITPDRHVYFVDCKEYENRDANSTSIYNTNEANVVIKLLDLINRNYNNNKNYQPTEETKMSVGIITTYGDQARIIRRRLKNARLNLNSFNKNPDAKLIISTVDDFQGDERDIIILSMVRNPEDRARSNPGFINAYERVNVALSRARRLLIIVGNRSYLENKGVVYLPDVYGNSDDDQPHFPIYKEVVNAIMRYGLIFDDEDVLGGKK